MANLTQAMNQHSVHKVPTGQAQLTYKRVQLPFGCMKQAGSVNMIVPSWVGCRECIESTLLCVFDIVLETIHQVKDSAINSPYIEQDLSIIGCICQAGGMGKCCSYRHFGWPGVHRKFMSSTFFQLILFVHLKLN